MVSQSSLIPLGEMPQQASIRSAEDDWTGIIDRTQRRRLQNRMNQRVYRLRHQPGRKRANGLQHNDDNSTESLTSALIDPAAHAGEQGDVFECTLAPPYADTLKRHIESVAFASHMQNSPDPRHLLSLSRLNIQRAIVDNTLALGMTMEWMKSDDALSAFNLQVPGFSEAKIPPCLRPTDIQRQIAHHPWLDFFPFPAMRDNLILMQDDIDDEELCHDLMAFWDTRDTGATMLVWGQSTDPANWEVTEAFVKKWGFLLRGCEALLMSSNRWRMSRGEKPLFWRQLLSLE